MGNPREVLPTRLYLLRAVANMSQTDLAKLLDTAPVQVSRYENGRVLPNADALVRISETFGCSVDYLLGLSDSRKPRPQAEIDFTPEERRIIAALRERRYSQLLHLIAMVMEVDLQAQGYSTRSTAPEVETGGEYSALKPHGKQLKNRPKRMRSRLTGGGSPPSVTETEGETGTTESGL